MPDSPLEEARKVTPRNQTIHKSLMDKVLTESSQTETILLDFASAELHSRSRAFLHFQRAIGKPIRDWPTKARALMSVDSNAHHIHREDSF